MILTEYQNLIAKYSGEKQLLRKQLKENKLSAKDLKKKKTYIEKAQALIQLVAQQTQEKLKVHIEDIVQMGLDSCWYSRYKFVIDFVCATLYLTC